MKKLNAKEFKRFLEVCADSPRPDNWDVPQDVVGVFADTGHMKHCVEHSFKALLLLGPEGSLTSVWFTAFQMGREFESRRKEESELKKLARL